MPMRSRFSTGACSTLGPWHADDRFASHAPFHFDLSVFDLFAACRAPRLWFSWARPSARTRPHSASSSPGRESACGTRRRRFSRCWRSKARLDRPDYRAPRLVLFAGEVFPIAALRRLRALWPKAMMWNLYGPTETNVCTACPIPATIPDDRTEPFPIGSVCLPLRARVVDEHGRDVPAGSLGELLIGGPGVMRGLLRPARR